MHFGHRERTTSKRYPSACPRPPLPRSVARALPDSTAILLPDKDTPFGHQGGTPKQIQSKLQGDHMHQARFFFLTLWALLGIVQARAFFLTLLVPVCYVLVCWLVGSARATVTRGCA